MDLATFQKYQFKSYWFNVFQMN